MEEMLQGLSLAFLNLWNSQTLLCFFLCGVSDMLSSLQTFLFRYAAPRSRSERSKWAVVMSEFAPICIYLVISPLVSLIPLGLPFLFSSNSSIYPENCRPTNVVTILLVFFITVVSRPAITHLD